MKTVNLNNRTTFYASDNLIEQLKAKYQGDDVLNFAYTDYGGDFFDKVVIDYFTKYQPDAIVSELTGWNGQNAFVFGPLAKEFNEAYERYPLGFQDIESHYYEMESEIENADFQRFIDDESNNYTFTESALDKLCELKGGYYSMTTQGLDFSWSELLQFCLDNGLCTKN